MRSSDPTNKHLNDQYNPLIKCTDDSWLLDHLIPNQPVLLFIQIQSFWRMKVSMKIPIIQIIKIYKQNKKYVVQQMMTEIELNNCK